MTPEECSLIEKNELFRDIDMESISYVLDECHVLAMSSGEKLLEIGKENSTLYLILEGELHVYLDNRDLTEHAVLKAGQCVGELSLIDGGHASALVIAAQNTRVLAIPHDQLWSLVDRSNGIARNLLCILAGRIRNDNLMRVTTSERSLVFEVPSNVDGLTGLYSRAWMDDAFPRVMMRCDLDKVPLCLMLADIDHFKNLNHTQGRPAGDAMLKMVSKVMAENLRPQDLLVYLGGDKFAILLPDTAPQGALEVAERLREVIATHEVRWSARAAESGRGGIRITISLGIAAMEPGDTLDALFSMAHMALYQAKAGGKNQVKVAEKFRDEAEQ